MSEYGMNFTHKKGLCKTEKYFFHLGAATEKIWYTQSAFELIGLLVYEVMLWRVWHRINLLASLQHTNKYSKAEAEYILEQVFI